jgi:hypothetical protein
MHQVTLLYLELIPEKSQKPVHEGDEVLCSPDVA